jgi:hypothetical protein
VRGAGTIKPRLGAGAGPDRWTGHPHLNCRRCAIWCSLRVDDADRLSLTNALADADIALPGIILAAIRYLPRS